MTISDLRVLVDNLDEYIHIPGGIDRLKKTVLHLAVSGQLVPQDPEEGTGEELYKQIQIKKAEPPKKQKELPEVEKNEELYEVPSSWKWSRLSAITNLITDGTHHTPQYKPSGVSFLSIKDVSGGSLDFSDCKYISQTEHEEINKRCNPELGDILFCRIGTLGRPVIVDTEEPFSIFVSLGLIKFNHELILPEYLRIYLDAPATYKEYRRVMAGGSHTNKLNLNTMNSLVTALPPFAEQKRIVKKVNEILALVEELDKKYKAEEAERSKFVRSSLRALSHDKSTLALDNLTQTIKTKADVTELRKAILHLAVSGQLVPQIPSEGTGEELYKEIRVEKTKLIASGKIKKQKELPNIEEGEPQTIIPNNWRWVRLGDFYDVRDGTHDTPKYVVKGYPLVTSKNLSSGSLDMSNIKYISEQDHKKIQERSAVERGDILFAMIGSIGNPVTVDVDDEFSIKNVALFKPYDRSKYNSEWLLTYLTVVAEDMRDKSSGAVQSFVSLGYIRNYLAPLPPLSEQKRIVQKTTELLDLVTKLEKHLEK